MIYPYSKELQNNAVTFSNGNFGLWFYKLIPLDERNDFKACAHKHGDKNIVSFYKETYDHLKKNIQLKKMLTKKHDVQQNYCRICEKNGAKIMTLQAELCTPLITGIGKTHPNEVGMTFDHSMGVPFLPATGIKGVVRLAHILNLIEDREKAGLLIQGDELDDSHPDSMIPDMFGGDCKAENISDKLMGKIVFLDAYPERIPDLQTDIMNPHYSPYYSDDSGKTPPADYLDPTPIQFLAVKKGEVFVFRAVINGNGDLQESLSGAFLTALTEQGFGAKTAVGYGRFKVKNSMVEKNTGSKKEDPEQLTGVEKLIRALDLIEANDMGRLGTIIQKIESLSHRHEKAIVAKAIKDKLPPKAFKKHKRKDYLLSLIKSDQ